MVLCILHKVVPRMTSAVFLSIDGTMVAIIRRRTTNFHVAKVCNHYFSSGNCIYRSGQAASTFCRRIFNFF